MKIKIGDLVVTRDGEQGTLTGWEAFPIRHQTAFVQVGDKEVPVPEHYLERVAFNGMQFIEQGANILWDVSLVGASVKTYMRGWLLGESDDFKEAGQYDIVIPQEGVVSVHWDRLEAFTPASCLFPGE